MLAVPARPAASVTVRSSVCPPGGTLAVFHMYVAVDPETLWLESVVLAACMSRNCVGEPCVLPAFIVTSTMPLTVAPSAGLPNYALTAGVTTPPDGAPEAYTGVFAFL